MAAKKLGQARNRFTRRRTEGGLATIAIAAAEVALLMSTLRPDVTAALKRRDRPGDMDGSMFELSKGQIEYFMDVHPHDQTVDWIFEVIVAMGFEIQIAIRRPDSAHWGSISVDSDELV